ncbi:MAG: DUF3141 domain-containing protein [Pseudomonadota bacterium]
MQRQNMTDNAFSAVSVFKDGYDYWYDAVQRSILFGDIIRKRGNAYNDHLEKGQPPVLAFDYEIISDGKDMERPVNYQLVKIYERRSHKPGEKLSFSERRELSEDSLNINPNQKKRPIVVIDPRAGHGPGIGGSKLDSQIGTALTADHPVYFIMFLIRPVKGQTISDVQTCQVFFLEEVARRHPDALKPAVIGNCQAGWAAALIAADRPDVTGPLVLNGSPLSYWGGIKGANPMRYRGGLSGGGWLASLCSDLGNGEFDGAHLVAGFEELNTANTLWTKQYNLYSKIDTEEQRFLDFEKWWGGFFLLSREEIQFIVSNLFISDELEQGFLKLHEGSYINLKNFKDPILVFASKGDNITPPQQALNWITKVYKDVEEIKKCGQIIVYLLHDSVGHLGIFVSSKVNQKEHKEIIGCVDAIEFLAPGLYEMVIKEGPSKPGLNDQQVEFVDRTMEDIHSMDDGLEDEEAFLPVAAVSKFNTKVYQDFISPWVRMLSTDFSAEFFKQLHPLRMQRYGFSDKNPFMLPLETLSDMTRNNRKPARDNNLFTSIEKTVSDQIITCFDLYQKNRDTFFETMFYAVYNNPWIKTLFYHDDDKQFKTDPTFVEPQKSEMFMELENQLWIKAMQTGGFEEAIIRIILAITNAKQVLDMAEYDVARLSMKSDKRLTKILPDQLKTIIKDQAAILEKNRNMALELLPDLIPEEKDRQAALEIARNIADIETVKKFKKTHVLNRIERILFPDMAQGHYPFSS